MNCSMQLLFTTSINRTLHLVGKKCSSKGGNVPRRVCTMYIYRVRFEMKIVGYLLHNGNGNGLGDWGQNLRKPSGPRPPRTPFVWPDKISARIEIHFCQN